MVERHSISKRLKYLRPAISALNVRFVGRSSQSLLLGCLTKRMAQVYPLEILRP